MSNEAKEIKITDKRMFTPDGELREEYRFLDDKSTAEPAAATTAGPSPATAAAPPAPGSARGEKAPAPRGAAGRQDAPAAARSAPSSAAGAPAAPRSAGASDPRASAPAAAAAPAVAPAAADHRAAPPAAAEPTARLELPGLPPGLGPSFYDLAELLAEPVPIYLGDVDLPDGQSAENIEMARLYIDLLDVLRQKTAGNLTAQESAFLEDLLYRLRVRYVQKRG